MKLHDWTTPKLWKAFIEDSLIHKVQIEAGTWEKGKATSDVWVYKFEKVRITAYKNLADASSKKNDPVKERLEFVSKKMQQTTRVTTK